MFPRPGLWLSIAATAVCAWVPPVSAQNALDRQDAAIAADRIEVERPAEVAPSSGARVASDAPSIDLAGVIEVSAITVEGAPSIPPALFLAATEPFLGRPLNEAELRTLATNVANVLRSRGFVFASAWVAPQAIEHGVLRVTADEGRIDHIRFVGRERPAVARALRGLTGGQPVTAVRLERALMIAGDLPGIDIRDSQYTQENGRGVLTVTPSIKRFQAYAGLDNHGSGSVGPVRLRSRVSFNNVGLDGDQLTFRATLTPLDPRELATVGGEYSAVIDRTGTVASLAGSVTRVQAGGRYRGFEYDGRSVSVNLGLMRPLIRASEDNLWVSLDAAFRDSEQDQRDILIRDDRVASLSLGLNGYALVKRGWLSGRVTLRQGLDVLGATESDDPLASREDGSGQFSKAEAYVEWSGRVSGRLALRVAAEGQLASRPLLSSEEFGVGGPRFGRAYEYSERRGDNGVAGLAELQYHVPGKLGPLDGVQVYGFVDGGSVDDLRRRDGGGGLASAGGGLRFDLGRAFDGEAELAAPIGKDRFETGDRSPRLNFSLNARF